MGQNACSNEPQTHNCSIICFLVCGSYCGRLLGLQQMWCEDGQYIQKGRGPTVAILPSMHSNLPSYPRRPHPGCPYPEALAESATWGLAGWYRRRLPGTGAACGILLSSPISQTCLPPHLSDFVGCGAQNHREFHESQLDWVPVQGPVHRQKKRATTMPFPPSPCWAVSAYDVPCRFCWFWRLEGPKMHRNLPQDQRVRQQDQQVTRNDIRIAPEVAYKGTKLCQNATKNAFFSSV